ncbi:unnamed protein product [Merluccius merluccius]
MRILVMHLGQQPGQGRGGGKATENKKSNSALTIITQREQLFPTPVSEAICETLGQLFRHGIRIIVRIARTKVTE